VCVCVNVCVCVRKCVCVGVCMCSPNTHIIITKTPHKNSSE